MAQPFKQGLDYFNVDVDLDEDEKIIALDEKFPETYKFIFFIWKFIYKHSYYVHWTELEIGKFQRKTKFNRVILDEIIEFCLEIEFFDRKLYEKYGILTSQSIQTRWLSNSRRRKHISLQHNFILIQSDVLKKLSVAALSITKNIESKFKSPIKSQKATTKPQKEVVDKPQVAKHDPQVDSVPKKNYGEFTHNEVLDFIKVPYSERTTEFKSLHKESWYTSYIKFNKEIDKDFPTLRVSIFQITLPEYKKIVDEHIAIINPAKVTETLKKMSSSGTQVNSDMDKRFVQFLLPQTKTINGKPKDTTNANTFYTGPKPQV